MFANKVKMQGQQVKAQQQQQSSSTGEAVVNGGMDIGEVTDEVKYWDDISGEELDPELVFARSDGIALHEFTRRRNDSSLEDRCHRASGGFHVVKRSKERLAILWKRNEAKGDFGDDSKRPFAPHQKLGEVVASDIFEELAAVPDDLTSGKHSFHAQDIVFGDSVFDGARAA